MKYRDLIRIVSEAGFVQVRSGKHEIWVNGNIELQIPHHKEINELTAKSIIRKAGLTRY